MPIGILNTPIHALALVAFLAGISAIMFTSAIKDLLLEEASPYIIMGIALLIIATIPIITHRKIPDPTFLMVVIAGLAFIAIGIWV